MVTAQSIYNSRGASYITKGTPLNDQYIARLKKLGVKEVHVTSLNTEHPLPPPEDVVAEKTRVKAIHTVFDTFRDFQNSERIDVSSLQTTSEELLLDIMSKHNNLIQITDIRLHDTYTFAHSVNVAVLSIMLGTLCSFSREKLLTLTLGALLHDIGKVVVPVDILNKPAALSDDEFEIIRRHPAAGRQKLRELNNLMASTLGNIAGQHHEHMDGSGYPDHLQGKNIHPLARIVAIADVYDALISHRPYRQGWVKEKVMDFMRENRGLMFDPQVVDAFFSLEV